MSRSTLTLLMFMILSLWLITGCDLLGGTDPPPDPPPPTISPAAAMLPNFSNYHMVEGQLLTSYIGSLSEGAAILAARPDLAAVAGAVDSIISCYQEVGAVRARLYSNIDEPLSAGSVAIADRNTLLDPANLFRCVLPAAAGERSAQSVTIEPCTANYTLERDGNTFYILYAATTQEACRDFCSALEGCTAH